jgi:hypothetical protein
LKVEINLNLFIGTKNDLDFYISTLKNPNDKLPPTQQWTRLSNNSNNNYGKDPPPRIRIELTDQEIALSGNVSSSSQIAPLGSTLSTGITFLFDFLFIIVIFINK